MYQPRTAYDNELLLMCVRVCVVVCCCYHRAWLMLAWVGCCWEETMLQEWHLESVWNTATSLQIRFRSMSARQQQQLQQQRRRWLHEHCLRGYQGGYLSLQL